MSTVGQLKRALEGLDDNMPLHPTHGPDAPDTVVLPIEIHAGAVRVRVVSKQYAKRLIG